MERTESEMMQDNGGNEATHAEIPREYIAFISYRHKDVDKYVAKRVHTLIERYVIPKELRKEKGKAGRKLGLVFRDEEELPVSSNLTESIETALNNTKYLIVVCTPNTPESVWVEREIAYFLQKHDRAHVIGVLADGTPDESFPKLLTTIYDEDGTTPIGSVEPLAANLTNNAHQFQKSRIKKEAVRLYAALLGCPFDSLWQREKRHKMKNAMALMALVLTIALSFCVSIYLKNLEIKAKSEMIANQNIQIQLKNDEIIMQYKEIQTKNSELRYSEAQTLIREGELLYERGEMDKAARTAVLAMGTKEGLDGFSADAEYLLNRSLAAGQYDNVMRTSGVIEQEREIVDLLVSDDGDRIYTMDDRGFIRCYSSGDGEYLWTADGLSRAYHSYVADRPRMRENTEGDILICQNEDGITALNVRDGSLCWNHVPSESSGTDFACYSKDGKTLAVIDAQEFMEKDNKLVIINTEDGTIRQEIPLGDIYPNLKLKASGRENGVFSEDGRYLTGTVYGVADYFEADSMSVFLADLQAGTVEILYEEPIETQYALTKPFVVGMVLNPQLESVLVLHYAVDTKSIRMDEIFWNHEKGKSSAVPITLPSRSLYRPYPCTFNKGENGALLAGCGELSLIYGTKDGELIASTNYSNSNVLSVEWMDEQKFTRTLLMDDGTQYAFYEDAGYAIAPCLDKIHVVKLAISRDYAENHGGFGHVLKQDAVAVTMCDDDLKKAYILKPSKDERVKEVDWFDDSMLEKGLVSYEMKAVNDDTLVLCVSDDEIFSLKFIEAATQKVISQYEFKSSEMPDHILFSELEQGIFWPDLRHVTIQKMLGTTLVMDLQTKAISPVFGEESIRDYGMARLKDGTVLHAGISNEETDQLVTGMGRLHVRAGDGDAVMVENHGEKSWIAPTSWGRSFIRLGQNGYVLLGEFSHEEEADGSLVRTANPKMETFYLLNALDSSWVEIKDECPASMDRLINMGSAKPLFVTADEDGYFRVYNVTSKNVEAKYPLPVSISEVQDVFLCKEDDAVAIWSLDRMLYLYDRKSGEVLFEGMFDTDERAASVKESITHVEDPSRNRLYFITSDHSVICIDTDYWKKTADFRGLDAFCPGTNEIYKIKYNVLTFREEGEGILRCPAYTLSELMELAK